VADRRERHAVVLAFHFEVDALGVGIERGDETDVARLVVVREVTLVEGQQLDVDARLFLGLGVLLHDPVLAAFGILLQEYLGLLQVDFRDDDAAGEERQDTDRSLDRLGLEQIVRLAPFRVGEAHAFGAEAGMHPAPYRREPLDDQLALGRLADGARDRPLHQVQPEHQRQGKQDNQDQDGPAKPFQGAHAPPRAKCVP
jgi:hypothetical protein